MRAALWAIGLTLICSCLRKSTRISFSDVVKGLIEGSKGVLGVLIACATAGVIIGVVTKTGVAVNWLRHCLILQVDTCCRQCSLQ